MIIDCEISNNTETSAAITCYELTEMTVVDCNISNNTEIQAALYCLDATDVTIRNCTMTNNQVTTQYAGTTGGVVCWNSEAVIENCTMTGNTGHSGGGLYLEDYSIAIVRNCLIADNIANFAGGGICSYFSDALIENCTIVNNEAVGMYGFGGGINVMYGMLSIDNCILWGNTGQGGNQMKNLTNSAGFSYCDIQDSGGSSNWDTSLGADDGGNIDADPNFVDTLFHISSSSPCYNTGDPNYVPQTDETDIDGDPRVIVNIDMGCDEVPTVYNIDQEEWFDTIQDAIDDAVSGDEIAVYPGTYDENIDFDGKAITLTGSDPDDWDVVEATIIDGGGSGSVVTFDTSEDANSVLTGFTITNGSASSDGGGIICDGASPTISNCIVHDNYADDSGGGIYCSSSDAIIENCIIHSNDGYEGGGIFCYNSDAIIKNCIVHSNDALDEGDGGGIYCYGGDAIIKNCIIHSNDTEYWGGGIMLNNADITIDNCTIAGNTASYHVGGGLYNYSSYPTITNTIFWGNEAYGYDQIKNYLGNPIISYCDIEDSGGSGAGWDSGLGTDGGGNIDSDPNFVDVTNDDYHLLSTSPCIDTGDNSVVASGDTDIDGGDRILDGDGNQTAMVDMGADEYDPS
jgi:hypothetical protein